MGKKLRVPSGPRGRVRRRVLLSAGGFCVLDGPRCETFATTIDHWVPKAKGGSHETENLRPSCGPCNQDKGDMWPNDWWVYALDKKDAETMMEQDELPTRRNKESDSDYQGRCYRWTNWKKREPVVDLWYVSDTEVGEYRQWAGTSKLHNVRVELMMAGRPRGEGA